MQQLLTKLDAIELKVSDLAEKLALLKKENQRLVSENKVLINDLDRLKKNKSRLESQLTEAMAEIKAGRNSDEEQKKLKKELGQYIKEIDKCILMMGEL